MTRNKSEVRDVFKSNKNVYFFGRKKIPLEKNSPIPKQYEAAIKFLKKLDEDHRALKGVQAKPRENPGIKIVPPAENKTEPKPVKIVNTESKLDG